MGKLLIYSPRQEALQSICQDVHNCNGDQTTLLNVGKWYLDHFIRTCKSSRLSFHALNSIVSVKAHKGSMTTSSVHPSRQSFQMTIDSIKENLKEPSIGGRRQAKKLVSTLYVLFPGPPP